MEHGPRKSSFAKWTDGRSQEKSGLSDQCEVQVGLGSNRGLYLSLLLLIISGPLHRVMCNQFFIHDLLNLLLASSFFFSFKIPLTLKMEAVHSSDMSVRFYQTTRRHIPKDNALHTYCYENLRPIELN
jgi:hypothetical protein